jgi:hypothetical protein
MIKWLYSKPVTGDFERELRGMATSPPDAQHVEIIVQALLTYSGSFSAYLKQDKALPPARFAGISFFNGDELHGENGSRQRKGKENSIQ